MEATDKSKPNPEEFVDDEDFDDIGTTANKVAGYDENGNFMDDDIDFDDIGKGLPGEKAAKKTNISQLMYKKQQEQVDEAVRNQWEAEQLALKQKLIMEDDFDNGLTRNNFKDNLKYIGAADISFSKKDNTKCVAALIICEYPSMKVVYEDYETDTDLDQPYIPGFLAFRELPIYEPLFNRLKNKRPDMWPQILLTDGNGVHHTRGFGLASHLGVVFNLPTIGCAKTAFAVDGLTKVSMQNQVKADCHKGGDFTNLVGNSGRTWGAALKATDDSTQPLYISIGHRVSLETAIEVTMMTLDKFRIPEPIRQADLRGRDIIRKAEGK